MANKNGSKKRQNLNSRREVVTSHPVMRAYLFIHLSKSSNCITEFSELTRTPSREYIYFWKAMINTAAKRILVQACYYMTREVSSTSSRINRQTSIPTEKCLKPAQKPRAAGSVNENTIKTESALLFVVTFDENSSPFLRFLDYSCWLVRDLKLVGRRCCKYPQRKKSNNNNNNARLFKSDGLP